MSRVILNTLNDQNVCACLLDTGLNIIYANDCLKDIFLEEYKMDQDKKLFSLISFNLFSFSEKELINEAFSHSFDQRAILPLAPKSLEHFIESIKVYLEGDHYICVFERKNTRARYDKLDLYDRKLKELESVNALLNSFKRLAILNQVAFLQLTHFGTVVDLISNDSKVFINVPKNGDKISSFFENDLVKKINIAIEKARVTSEICRFEYHTMELNIKNWFVIELSLIQNGCIVMIRDITKEKQKIRLEVENDRLTTLGILAGGLAHQFNNIHHVILGNLDLINYVETQEQLDDCVNTVRKSIVKASNLTQKLLSFSRNKKEFIEPSSIENIVKASYEFTEEKFLKAKVNFSISRDNKDLYVGLIDNALFEQVLINLFINSIQAVDYSKDNHFVKVLLSLSSDEKNIYCDVVDNGTGIDIGNIDKVFTPLFTTKGEFSKSEGDKEKGTGLGLSLSRKLISNMGGHIQLLETSANGTTFRISVKKANYQNITRQNLKRTSLELDNKDSINVVVFDDEYETRRYLLKYFSTYKNVNVKEYSDGNVKVQEIVDFKPDVILLDWIMPNRNGHDVLASLHKESPDLVKKTIVISGHIPENEFDDWEDKVANKLSKPLTIDDLNEAIFHH